LSTSDPDQLAIESRRWLRLAKDDLAGPQGLQNRVNLDAAKELSAWAIQGRYPGDAPEATREQATHAVDLASGIVSPSRTRRSGRATSSRQGV
jgi:hypothetical protein